MSLIKRTNQQWKVYVFIGLMTLGCALTLSQPLYKDWLGESLTLRVGINAMMLVVANFVWACLFITCPHCKLKLFFFALTKKGLGSWFAWLTEEDKCPQCGSLDGSAPPAPKYGKSKKR